MNNPDLSHQILRNNLQDYMDRCIPHMTIGDQFEIISKLFITLYSYERDHYNVDNSFDILEFINSSQNELPF